MACRGGRSRRGGGDRAGGDRSVPTPADPVRAACGRSGEPDAKEAVRLKLGRWLAVALELELGAAILRTAVAPTWTEIGLLGAIAVLRTALNFFLQQEIDKAEARRTGASRTH